MNEKELKSETYRTNVRINRRAAETLKRQGKEISKICNKAVINAAFSDEEIIRPVWVIEEELRQSKILLKDLETKILIAENELKVSRAHFQSDIAEILDHARENIHRIENVRVWVKAIRICTRPPTDVMKYFSELENAGHIKIENNRVLFLEQVEGFKTDLERVQEQLEKGLFTIKEIADKLQISEIMVDEYLIELGLKGQEPAADKTTFTLSSGIILDSFIGEPHLPQKLPSFSII